MTLTVIQDPRLLAWANARLDAHFEPERCRWVAGFEDAGPIFVVVYLRFSPRNVELALATDGTKRWATRRALRLIFSQPFKTWKLARCTFVVEGDNVKSIDMLDRLGAVREGCIRCAFAHSDGYVYGMLAKECKWT
jgi:RimJ/RimL family protein N-acetyltransferase